MKKIIVGIALFVGFILLLDISSAIAADSPDLSLEKNMVAPSPITQGAWATLTVVVKNIGKAKNRAVTLFFLGDENALQAFGIPLDNGGSHGVPMPELAAGQVFTYTSTKVIKIPAGNYTIRAIIWPGRNSHGPVPQSPTYKSEGNLINNEKEVQFTVKKASSNLGPKHKIPTNPSGQGVLN